MELWGAGPQRCIGLLFDCGFVFFHAPLRRTNHLQVIELRTLADETSICRRGDSIARSSAKFPLSRVPSSCQSDCGTERR